jgi:hypothetical protein
VGFAPLCADGNRAVFNRRKIMVHAQPILVISFGANRIVRTRLLLVPGSPVGLEVTKGRVCIQLRNGQTVDLVKDVRFYSEIGGKTFAITGMDLSGQKQQYVFHLGQFQDEAAYKSAKSYLEVYR